MRLTRFLLLPLCAVAALGQSTFVPETFQPPQSYETARFKLVPLGPDLAKHDYDAYMSSIDHLRTTFSSGSWPHDKLTMEDALKDVQGEEQRFKSRRAFTYAVLTPDGSREMGCVYVRPSPKVGYDAQVAMWVTKAEFDRGFEPELLQEVKSWMKAAWPFRKVAYPKRDISAADWQALPNKPGERR